MVLDPISKLERLDWMVAGEGLRLGKEKRKREKKIEDMYPITIWTHNIAGSTFNATRISDLFCSLGPPRRL